MTLDVSVYSGAGAIRYVLVHALRVLLYSLDFIYLIEWKQCFQQHAIIPINIEPNSSSPFKPGLSDDVQVTTTCWWILRFIFIKKIQHKRYDVTHVKVHQTSIVQTRHWKQWRCNCSTPHRYRRPPLPVLQEQCSVRNTQRGNVATLLCESALLDQEL